MTSFLNSLAEFTKRDYAFVQPDSPEADAVFIKSISHVDGKVWINHDPKYMNRTSFSNADFESPRTVKSNGRPNSWEGAAMTVSQWTQSAACMMADTFANSAKYVSESVQKNKNFELNSTNMKPSTLEACSNTARKPDDGKPPRRKTIPSLYGPSADNFEHHQMDDPYDPISRSTIYVVEDNFVPHGVRKRYSTTEEGSVKTFKPNGHQKSLSTSSIKPSNQSSFVNINSWIGLSSSSSSPDIADKSN